MELCIDVVFSELGVCVAVVVVRGVIEVYLIAEGLNFATNALSVDDVFREVLFKPSLCLGVVEVVFIVRALKEVHADSFVSEGFLWGEVEVVSVEVCLELY